MLDTDVAELLETGCSLIIGTVDAQAIPEAARGWALEVSADRTSLRLLVSTEATVALANLAPGAKVAVTATEIATLRSLQVKGHSSGVDEVTRADRARHDAYVAAFIQAVHDSDGTPLDLLARMKPHGITAFVMSVDELYDQTPGPTAGQRL